MENHRFINIASSALSQREAEERILEALALYGEHRSRTELKRPGVEIHLIDQAGKKTVTDIGELVRGTMTTGEIPALDRLRWRDKDPYGSLFIATEASVPPPIVLGAGLHTSRPLTAPGFVTNCVVTDYLEDVLHYRRAAANMSIFTDSFRECFRNYRAYLASSITAIDAFLNREAWFVLNDPGRQLSAPEQNKLKKKSLPLNTKIQCWLPIFCGSHLSEGTQSWNDLQALKSERNEYVHVNEPSYAFELKHAVDLLNACRLGVGEMLIQMTTLVGRYPLPATFRVRYAPLVSYVT